MAITLWRPSQPTSPLAQTFAIDPALLQSRAAQEARRRGILLAKEQALASAERLLRRGRLLSVGVIFVSALHIWEAIAGIAPATVPSLVLPAPLYYAAALAFTLLIDLVALFIGRANAVALMVPGATINRWSGYFYVATGLLNASYVAGHAPALSAAAQQQILPLLAGLFVILLPLSVPVGIVAIEASCRTLEASRLILLMEVATLRELSAARAAPPSTSTLAGNSQNASGSVLTAPTQDMEAVTAAPIEGGRPTAYTVAELLAAFTPTVGPDDFFSPRDVQEQLRCSESSAHRLIREAVEAGAIVRAGRGLYRARQTA